MIPEPVLGNCCEDSLGKVSLGSRLRVDAVHQRPPDTQCSHNRGGSPTFRGTIYLILLAGALGFAKLRA